MSVGAHSVRPRADASIGPYTLSPVKIPRPSPPFFQNRLVPCPLLCYNTNIVPENVRRGGKKSLCVAASHAEGVYV